VVEFISWHSSRCMKFGSVLLNCRGDRCRPAWLVIDARELIRGLVEKNQL
jgi:hypothetical protein